MIFNMERKNSASFYNFGYFFFFFFGYKLLYIVYKPSYKNVSQGDPH